MIFRWLTEADEQEYFGLVAKVSQNMLNNGKTHQVDFLHKDICRAALKEGNVYSMWDGETLISTLIAAESNIGQIYQGDFSQFDGNAVYLRNGMVHPDYIGCGLYSQFMQAVSSEIEGNLVGTITVDNKAAQHACASAGFEPVSVIPYLSKNANVVLMCRYAFQIQRQESA